MQLATSAYPHVLSDFGGDNLPNIGIKKAHLFRKNAYLDLWELILELQSVFDLIAAIKRPFSDGRGNFSGFRGRFSAASIFNTAKNASRNS